MRDWVRIWVTEVLRETDKALLCLVLDADGVEAEYWIPISQIAASSEVRGLGDEGILVIPGWLAERNNISVAESQMPGPRLSLADLKTIYRDLVSRWHPDRAGADGHAITIGINAFWEKIQQAARLK